MNTAIGMHASIVMSGILIISVISIFSVLLKLRETHVDELLKVIEYISEMCVTALSQQPLIGFTDSCLLNFLICHVRIVLEHRNVSFLSRG